MIAKFSDEKRLSDNNHKSTRFLFTLPQAQVYETPAMIIHGTG